MLNSIWTDQLTLPSFASMKGDLKTDVLIIGGGMAGILCAWKLQQAGVPYALVEADRIGSGITRNTTAKLTVHHGLIYERLLRTYGAEKAKMYYLANKQALENYAGLAKDIDCDFQVLNNYLYSTASAADLEGEAHALQQLHIPFSMHKEVSLPLDVTGAISMDNQAQFHPLKFLSSVAKGLNIYEQTKVREFTDAGVITDMGKIRASKIIVATHFPIWNKHGGYFMKMYQDRSYVIALENAVQVEGMYLDVSGKGLSFRNHGPNLLLGGGNHRTGKQTTAWEGLREAARKYYPEAKEVTHWAAQDCMTLDGIPYIGQYGKNTPNLYVATGFNKWGMTSSMVAANILSDMILGKDNSYASCFSPQRSSLHLQLLTNAVEATVSLLNPVRPKCPHLGCSLKWNPRERSWDCPCHGSRFGEGGAVLDGPSTGNLPGND